TEFVGNVRSWEVATGMERRAFARQAGGRALCFSPDGAFVATAGNDTTALVWDVVRLPVPRKNALAPEELDARWSELIGEDARRAEEAIWTLAAYPRQTLPFLRERLRTVPAVDPQRMTELIANLDSERAAVRNQAFLDL